MNINLTSHKKLVNECNKLINFIDKDIDKIVEKYAKKVKRELPSTIRSVIDKFYDDHDPNSYDRKGDLYNTFFINVEYDKWEVDFDPIYMEYEHRVDNDYIYEWVFQKGYHGGAAYGEDHPDPGTPWWRFGKSTDSTSEDKGWYKPAKRANFSPYEEAKKVANEYISETEAELKNEIRAKFYAKVDLIKNQIVKAYRGDF